MVVCACAHVVRKRNCVYRDMCGKKDEYGNVIVFYDPVKNTFKSFEPRCEKAGFLHMRKQRRRSAAQ